MDATLDHHVDRNALFLRPLGAWVVEEARRLEEVLKEVTDGLREQAPPRLVIDLSRVEAMDTAGVFLLARIERAFTDAGRRTEWTGADRGRAALVKRVREAMEDQEPAEHRSPDKLLSDIGDTVLTVSYDARRLLGTLGAVVSEIGLTILHPTSFRGKAVVRQMEMAGLRAVPIVVLMAFLIGGIVAQQGAFQLQFFGAAIFTVDLVGILSLREVSVLLTAIMVAGRSGSAITAELGSMQMREEVDALRVMGLDPINVLVAPRIIALILVLPLLTFLSGIATLIGAMFTLWFYVDIPPAVFLARLQLAIDLSSVSSGLIKAPFMALIIGLISCTEGMAVRGSAESLGRHTTASVVKSIFMVIVVDGVFAIFYGAINF